METAEHHKSKLNRISNQNPLKREQPFDVSAKVAMSKHQIQTQRTTTSKLQKQNTKAAE
jgi:hypothetical protein